MSGLGFGEELKELLEFAKLLVKTLSGWLTLVTALVPIAGFAWKSLAPPWPAGSPVILVFVSVILVLGLFLAFRVVPEARVRAWAKGLCITGLTLFVFYLLLVAVYLVDVDGQIHYTGFALTEEATKAVDRSQGPPNTAKDLLAYFGYESEDRIWIGRGILKWVLLVLCMAASSASAGGFSLFLVALIVHQKNAAPPASVPSTQPVPGPS